MASFTRAELDKLVTLVSDIKWCYGTIDIILNHYYGGYPPKGIRLERITVEEYEDIDDGRTYMDYVLDEIEDELNRSGLVGVDIENGSGGANDQTFDHKFILYRADDQVYRIESYVNLYCSRVVYDPDWKTGLRQLMLAKPGTERLNIWNTLFSAQETRDQSLPLDITIHTRQD